MTGPDPARDRLAGILLIVLSSVMFGCLDGLSKVLVETASPAQIIWARYVLGIPILLLATRPADIGGLLVTRSMVLQILRGATPLFISFGMVLGVTYLPLADTTVILFLAPVLVVALSAPLLGETVHRAAWIAVGFGFVAVLIVARPGFSALSVYALYPLMGAVFFAILQIITRQLGARGEKPQTTLAWTLLTGGIVMTPIVLFSWTALDLRSWLLMIALGATFGIAQLAQIAGLARAPASLVAPLSYVQIISAVVFGFIVFGERPDVWTIAGIVMIVGSGLYVVQQRRR